MVKSLKLDITPLGESSQSKSKKKRDEKTKSIMTHHEWID